MSKIVRHICVLIIAAGDLDPGETDIAFERLIGNMKTDAGGYK